MKKTWRYLFLGAVITFGLLLYIAYTNNYSKEEMERMYVNHSEKFENIVEHILDQQKEILILENTFSREESDPYRREIRAVDMDDIEVQEDIIYLFKTLPFTSIWSDVDENGKMRVLFAINGNPDSDGYYTSYQLIYAPDDDFIAWRGKDVVDLAIPLEDPRNWYYYWGEGSTG